MKYTAKPYLFNNIRAKSFDEPMQAVLYLNDILSDKGVDEKLDYVFIAPKATEGNLKNALEDYIGMSKIIIEE
jgi:hypothetical protein